MAFFLATNVLSTTPPDLTPGIVSSRQQYIELPIDATQAYIVNSKIRLMGNNVTQNGDDYLGNYADTSYGNSWRFYCGGGSYDSSGGWSRFQDSHARIDMNPCADVWFDFQEGPTIFKLDGSGNTYSFPSYENANYPLCLFGLPDRPNNRSACALARTTITLDNNTVMDLIPINEIGKVDTIAEQWFTDKGNIIINPTITNRTFIRDYLRIETKLEDSNGVIHFADPMNISLSNFTPGVGGWFTYDNGMQSYIDVFNDQIRLGGKYPAGAARVFVGLYNSGNTKEGGFYDIVNDKYYFSNTSTPLVYSEL